MTEGALDLPEVVAEAEAVRAEQFLAGGTLVSTDEAERPSPERLAARLDGDPVGAGLALP